MFEGMNWGDLLYLNPITGAGKLGYDLATGRWNQKPATQLQANTAPESARMDAASQVPGYQAWQDQIQAMIKNSQGRQVQFDTGPQAQTRADQMALSQMLMAQARGEGPSMAQMQLQKGYDQAARQNMSLAASLGGRRGGEMRMLQNQNARANLGMASDSAMLRAQEMMQARGLAGQQLMGQRGQDIGLAQHVAQTQLQQQGLNDQQIRAMLGMGVDLSGLQGGRNMSAADFAYRQNMRREDMARDDQRRKEAQEAAIWQGIFELGGTAAGMYGGGPAGAKAGGAAGKAVGRGVTGGRADYRDAGYGWPGGMDPNQF